MCCSSSSSGQQRSAHAHSVSTSAGNAQNTNGHSTMFVSTSAAILISHVVNAHIKQFYKCAECPRAFQSKDKFVHHAKTQHAGPGTFKILYKSSAKSSMFFSDVRKLISHLGKLQNLQFQLSTINKKAKCQKFNMFLISIHSFPPPRVFSLQSIVKVILRDSTFI